MEVKNTIVIITHNSGHIIRGALSALKQSQVLVFDNASKDDTRLICKNELSNVQLIESPTNLGYGRAANKAFNKVGSKYALLLNPDVEIDHDALRALVARADKLQSNWLYIAPNTGHTVTEIDVEKQEPGLKRITDATGCALLINLENFRKLGGFDHNIFLYYEEMDLSERARNAGLEMFYAEDICFPHNSRQSVAASKNLDVMRNWHFQWSSLYYKKKHRLWARLIESIIVNLFVSPIKQLTASPERAARYSVKRRATIDFIFGRQAFDSNNQPHIPQ